MSCLAITLKNAGLITDKGTDILVITHLSLWGPNVLGGKYTLSFNGHCTRVAIPGGGGGIRVESGILSLSGLEKRSGQSQNPASADEKQKALFGSQICCVCPLRRTVQSKLVPLDVKN